MLRTAGHCCGWQEPLRLASARIRRSSRSRYVGTVETHVPDGGRPYAGQQQLLHSCCRREPLRRATGAPMLDASGCTSCRDGRQLQVRRVCRRHYCGRQESLRRAAGGAAQGARSHGCGWQETLISLAGAPAPGGRRHSRESQETLHDDRRLQDTLLRAAAAACGAAATAASSRSPKHWAVVPSAVA